MLTAKYYLKVAEMQRQFKTNPYIGASDVYRAINQGEIKEKSLEKESKK